MWVPYPPLPEYLQTVDDTLQKRGPEQVLSDLGSHARSFPEHDSLSEEQRQLLTATLKTVRRIAQQFGPSDRSLVFELMILGKLGAFDEAIERGQGAYRANQNWANAIAVGNALKRAGKISEAIDMFDAASRLDETDVSAPLEAGDLELEQGNYGAATPHYAKALQRAPAHPWAEPSLWFCNYMMSREDSWLEKLKQSASVPQDECGVEESLAELLGVEPESERTIRAASLLEKVERVFRLPRGNE